jgi:exosortase
VIYSQILTDGRDKPRTLTSFMITRNQGTIFVFLCSLSLLFWWRSLLSTVSLALGNDAYTHILLILPLSAALIYMDSKYSNSKYLDSKAPRIESQPSPRSGAALLVLALLIGFYEKWKIVAAANDVRLSIAMSALVTWWIASVVLCFGIGIFRRFLFPLLFLFLVVPLPGFAVNKIVEFLQIQSASVAQIMFRAIGVPATRDGILLYIPDLTIEVATECSSIRSSLMLTVTTMVFAHLFLRSWWRKLLLVAAAIPLSVVKNALRIVTIAQLGTRVDSAFLTGKLHHNGGIVFFAISVVGMGALLWLLYRNELHASGAKQESVSTVH